MAMRWFLGCDLGGTNLRAGIVDVLTGEFSQAASIPTVAREGHNAVMARMVELLQSVLAAGGISKAEVGGIGIGVPGMLDLERGTVLFLPNLPGTWPDVPLAGIISQKLGLPVSLLNDVRSITYGEWKFGAGRGVDTMACFAVGTGIGGGLVIDGRLHLGIDGTAGELGHQTVEPDGLLCGCGNRGCVEAYASGAAITAFGLKAVTQGLTTKIGDLAGHDLNKITPELICQAALEGDEIAQGIYQLAGRYLGIAIANILVAVSPRRVVIGGGVAQAGHLFFNPIRQTVRTRVKMKPVEKVEIIPAELGADAGILGAAAWAHHRGSVAGA